MQSRGYVAIAVVGETDDISRDYNTGLGTDRAANMVAAAIGALNLVKEFITDGGKGDKL